MKGYFNIKHDPYTGELCFCNLPDASLGYLRDSWGKYSEMGKLVAHDVVEHSLSHRNKSYVTFEDEIRALGASSFVRPSHFNSYDQVLYQCMDMERDVKPVPNIVAKFIHKHLWLDVGMMRYICREGIKPSNARNATYQFAWGNYQKSRQFNHNYGEAYQAFRLIEGNMKSVMEDISEEDSYGASIFFDSVKHIFRWQLKRKP